jgi:hypothetical protein
MPAKPIPYSDEIRPEDTENAMKTVAVQMFPDEIKPYAVDYGGKCPRCADDIQGRQPIVAVAGAIRMSEDEIRNFMRDQEEQPSGDESFDVTCQCGVAHPKTPKDVRGCGARFTLRAVWP